MAIKSMFPAISNSPGTELAEDITAAQTTINVISGSALPDAPNLFTIGSDETAETVQYSGKNGNTLTGCTRGFDGTTAKGWSAGTKVARYFAAYDHDTFIGNITDLDGRVTSAKETADTAKATADKAETPTGAQAKADQALKDAKAHTTMVTDNMNKDYVRFSGWGGKTGGSGDVFTLSVTAGTTVLDGFGVSFEANRDSSNPSLKVNQYDPYPIVEDSVNKKPVKLVTGKVYSVRKSGGYFLLDSGSAAGGAAFTNETELTVEYGEDLKVGDFVSVNYTKNSGNSGSNEVILDVPLPNAVKSVAYSRPQEDGTEIVIFACGDPGNNWATSVHVYKVKGLVGTKQPALDNAPSVIHDVEVTPDGKFVFIGVNDGNKIIPYQDVGSRFASSSVSGTIEAPIRRMRTMGDKDMIAFITNASSAGSMGGAIKRKSDGIWYRTARFNGTTNNDVPAMDYNEKLGILAVAFKDTNSSSVTYLYFYKYVEVNQYFEKIVSFAIDNTSTNVGGLAFTADGKYLYVTTTSSPYVQGYDMSTFTKLSSAPAPFITSFPARVVADKQNSLLAFTFLSGSIKTIIATYNPNDGTLSNLYPSAIGFYPYLSSGDNKYSYKDLYFFADDSSTKYGFLRRSAVPVATKKTMNGYSSPIWYHFGRVTEDGTAGTSHKIKIFLTRGIDKS